MTPSEPPCVAVIGGGPAGLMAAEVLLAGGLQVDLYDAMPSLGRKFLMAGKGGLNLTHAESMPAFIGRYGARQSQLAPMLDAFGPQALVDWAHALGVDTFVGSSGRVFPIEMKAAPLLRAWLHRLRQAGLRVHVRHRWLGWVQTPVETDPAGDFVGQHALHFDTPDGAVRVNADAVILALGGGSWSRLGSDGRWAPWLREQGVVVAPLRPANCGFDVGWSPVFVERNAGAAVKSVVASFADASGQTRARQGEFVVTRTGVEGSLVYAFSAALRDAIAEQGRAVWHLDLAPGKSLQRVADELARPRGRDSMSTHLRRRVGIDGVKAGLLREVLDKTTWDSPEHLAAAIKHLPVTLLSPRPLDEAISSAGGVCFEALDERLMLTGIPGFFCAGEMLDWEAPTGGYLLTACFSSGYRAGRGALEWLRSRCLDAHAVGKKRLQSVR